jgi:hypothetical protein
MPLDFYSDAQLSERLAYTPERFLIARDAVVARCGDQIYAQHEVPQVQADANGLITVSRDPDEVLNPTSLASYTGKPLVFGHPDELVDGSNYRDLAVGHVIAARAGEDDAGPVVLADMVITDRDVAEMVARGTHRALSVGYEADYLPLGIGRAKQREIIANHIAILPNGDARCGDRCVVRDSRGKSNMRRGTRDQSVVRVDPNFVQGMGLKPGGDVGPSIVARLAYPASALSIGTDGDGNAVVWFHGPIENKLDAGTMTQGTRPLPGAEEDVLRRHRQTATGDTARRAMVARDAAWCRNTLQRINSCNREFWQQNQGKA